MTYALDTNIIIHLLTGIPTARQRRDDILIAAFCVVNDYLLVTDNTKHFKDIDGLQFVNWVE